MGRLQVNVAYKINCGRYDNDLSKYSCVGCPVRLCRWPDNKCDYIENPAVDARGIEGYASRMNYAVVDLPEVNSGSGEMVGIDDAVEYPIMTYKKTGDEFWLNATIDQEQCNGMPDPRRPQVRHTLKTVVLFFLLYITHLTRLYFLLLRMPICKPENQIQRGKLQHVRLPTHGICPSHSHGPCLRFQHWPNHHPSL